VHNFGIDRRLHKILTRLDTVVAYSKKVMSRALYAHFLYILLALVGNSCFGPGADALSSAASCTGNNFLVFGKWKLVKGYPASWAYGGSNPTPQQLQNDYRVLLIERGEDMCMVNVINRALQDPPVFRMKYSHDIAKQVLNIQVFYNGTNLQTWQKESVTYKLTGCSGAKPILTLTYANGYTETYEVFNRSINGGDCGNPRSPSGS
jgi:hypothetical protein